MGLVKIVDELGFTFTEKCESEADILRVLKMWLKNLDETPLEKITIEFE